MIIHTIGFTKTNAESFFGRLKKANVIKLIDVRLNNVSQLAGFAKRDDLKFFLASICNIGYTHEPNLAPTQSMLSAYKKSGGAWSVYENEFLGLIRKRKIESLFKPEQFDGVCLLCSEDTPHQCHRRLVAEYLRDQWGNVEIRHL